MKTMTFKVLSDGRWVARSSGDGSLHIKVREVPFWETANRVAARLNRVCISPWCRTVNYHDLAIDGAVITCDRTDEYYERVALSRAYADTLQVGASGRDVARCIRENGLIGAAVIERLLERGLDFCGIVGLTANPRLLNVDGWEAYEGAARVRGYITSLRPRDSMSVLVDGARDLGLDVRMVCRMLRDKGLMLDWGDVDILNAYADAVEDMEELEDS